MNASMLPPPASITHAHLLACVNSLLAVAPTPATRAVRILDAGCGNGKFISYLYACLAQLRPDLRIEFFGFDVVDHGVQATGFIERTVAGLSETLPDVDWSSAIRTIRATDDWPFDNDFFDVVVSNQVLEHVHDHPLFFRQAYRVLKTGGASVHLFPLEHYIYEGHLHLPWVHRIRSWDLMKGYIALLSRLGMGKYPAHRRERGVSVDEFAEQHADYMFFWTNYMSEREAVDVARCAGLRVSYRYTAEFYLQKIRSLFRSALRTTYRNEGRSCSDAIAIKLLRYVSSITLTCIKESRY